MNIWDRRTSRWYTLSYVMDVASLRTCCRPIVVDRKIAMNVEQCVPDLCVRVDIGVIGQPAVDTPTPEARPPPLTFPTTDFISAVIKYCW